MPARERLNPTEQYVAWLIGAGIALVIITLILIGFGTIDNDNVTTSLLIVGLALIVIGVGAWLILVKPWLKFDDLKTPFYTGHHEDAHAAPAETPGESLVPVQEHAADIALGDAIPTGSEEAPAAVVPPTDVFPAPAGPMIEPAGVEEVIDAPLSIEAAPVEEAFVEPAESAAEAVAPLETALPAPAEPAAAPLPDDLELIEGIGPKIAAALRASGVTTFAQVAEMSPADLDAIVKQHQVRAVGRPTTWPAQAQMILSGDMTAFSDFKRRIRAGVAHDDLTQIEGIGPKAEVALYQAGIHTFADLAHAAPDRLRTALDAAGLKSVEPGSWIEQAELIVANDLTRLQALQERLRGGH